MSRVLLKLAKRSLPSMILRDFELKIKIPIVQSFRCLLTLSDESGTEGGKLFVGFQSAKAFLGFQHRGCGPAQRHRCRTPVFHVAADAANRAHHVLDDIRASERSSQVGRQTEPRDGEYLVEPLEKTAGDPGRLAFQALREIAKQSPGLRGVVQLPGLAERAADRGMERLRQPLHDVAGLVDLAALDRRVASKTAPDRPR